MALKFGTMYKTPAMQAGLADKPLTFRQIFTLGTRGHVFFVLVVFEYQRPLGPALEAAA